MEAKIPAKLRVLFEPKRYKIVVGGRGKGASWGIADALLIKGSQQPLRWLCTRETQNSIEESVHALLSARIVNLGLERFYQVQQRRIISLTTRPNQLEENDPLEGRCGFSFAGLKANTATIKSYESFDGCWVEEAESVSDASWRVLIPTFRKDGSEIWISFNPQLDTDPTYKRFVLAPPADSVVIRMSWRDNPFFPETLRKEMDELRRVDPEECDHVYEGHPRSAVVGAIYAREIKLAEAEGRITNVPYDANLPVMTFWDLGWSDLVSIWFVQNAGFAFKVIDYHQDNFQSMDHYLQVLQNKGYTYSRVAGLPAVTLPWDAASKMAQGSMRQAIAAKGFSVRILERDNRATGIDATRRMFGRLWFDGEKCADGLAGLRRYQWGPPSAQGNDKREPLHDAASHPADALRTMAVSIRDPEIKEKRRPLLQDVREPDFTPFG